MIAVMRLRFDVVVKVRSRVCVGATTYLKGRAKDSL